MIMPAPFVSVGSSGYVLTLGAATLGGSQGYSDGTFGVAVGGTLTPNVTENGNVVGVLAGDSSGNNLFVEQAEPALSTITIDGTPYALNFVFTSSGYDAYSFSTGVQRIFSGNTYSVELS